MPSLPDIPSIPVEPQGLSFYNFQPPIVTLFGTELGKSSTDEWDALGYIFGQSGAYGHKKYRLQEETFTYLGDGDFPLKFEDVGGYEDKWDDLYLGLADSHNVYRITIKIYKVR
jgi:hypothetical protein